MTVDAADAQGPHLTEADFQQRIIDLAGLTGWRVAHFRAAQTARGWRTPVQGDRGFPDIVLAKPGHLIFAELKSDRGRLGPGQQEWLSALAPHARLWRPDDWGLVEGHLIYPEKWVRLP